MSVNLSISKSLSNLEIETGVEQTQTITISHTGTNKITNVEFYLAPCTNLTYTGTSTFTQDWDFLFNQCLTNAPLYTISFPMDEYEQNEDGSFTLVEAHDAKEIDFAFTDSSRQSAIIPMPYFRGRYGTSQAGVIEANSQVEFNLKFTANATFVSAMLLLPNYIAGDNYFQLELKTRYHYTE